MNDIQVGDYVKWIGPDNYCKFEDSRKVEQVFPFIKTAILEGNIPRYYLLKYLEKIPSINVIKPTPIYYNPLKDMTDEEFRSTFLCRLQIPKVIKVNIVKPQLNFN